MIARVRYIYCIASDIKGWKCHEKVRVKDLAHSQREFTAEWIMNSVWMDCQSEILMLLQDWKSNHECQNNADTPIEYFQLGTVLL